LLLFDNLVNSRPSAAVVLLVPSEIRKRNTVLDAVSKRTTMVKSTSTQANVSIGSCTMDPGLKGIP
jgi:hypothetical protein